MGVNYELHFWGKVFVFKLTRNMTNKMEELALLRNT